VTSAQKNKSFDFGKALNARLLVAVSLTTIWATAEDPAMY
jgi:hypothetical protein